MSVEYFTKKNV